MLSIAVGVFEIVCLWMLFEKAGLPGWGAIIPFYNLYLMCKTFRPKLKWMNTFVIYIILTIFLTITVTMFTISIIFATLNRDSSDIFMILISAALMIIMIALLIVVNCFLFSGMARAFGQPTSFAVGLVLLPVVFIAIIALNKEIQYLGNGFANMRTDNDGAGPANMENTHDSDNTTIE